MVDLAIVALGLHCHDAVDHIIDIGKCARLGAIGLDLEPCLARLFRRQRTQDELRRHMLPAHIWTIDIVRPEHLNLAEMFLAIVEGDQFRDNLGATIGVSRIEAVWQHQGHAFVRRDRGRLLVDLGRACHDKVRHIGPLACLDHGKCAPQADIQHQFGLGIEVLGPIDRREMEDDLGALAGSRDGLGIAHIAGAQIYLIGNLGKPALIAAQHVVDADHIVPVAHELLDQIGTDETTPACDDYPAHACTFISRVPVLPTAK